MSDRTHGPTRAIVDPLHAQYGIIQVLSKKPNQLEAQVTVSSVTNLGGRDSCTRITVGMFLEGIEFPKLDEEEVDRCEGL